MKTYSKDFLIVTRSIGTIIALPFAFFAIPHLIDTIKNVEGFFMQNMQFDGIIMTLVMTIFLLGYLVSWIKVSVGGIIIVLAGLLVTFPLIIVEGNIGALIFGIPFTGAGLLYVIYWRSKRKYEKIKMV